MIENKPILAIETSQSCCAACIYYDSKRFFEMSVNQKYLHAEKIFEIIDSVLEASETNLKELGAIAVSSGPGSFTGLRIGMSAAKGIAFGANLPIIAVPTFEAFAFQLAHILKDGTEFVIANKVNSDEIYYAKFQVKSNNYIFARNLQIIRKTEEMETDYNCLFFGNAEFGKYDPGRTENLSCPKVEYVAKWAEKFGNTKLIYDFEFLEPNYLKQFIVKDNAV